MHQANEFNCYLNAVFLIEMDRLRALSVLQVTKRASDAARSSGADNFCRYPAISSAKGAIGRKYFKWSFDDKEIIGLASHLRLCYWQKRRQTGGQRLTFPRTFSRCIGVTLLARCSDFTATSTLHGG